MGQVNKKQARLKIYSPHGAFCKLCSPESPSDSSPPWPLGASFCALPALGTSLSPPQPTACPGVFKPAGRGTWFPSPQDSQVATERRYRASFLSVCMKKRRGRKTGGKETVLNVVRPVPWPSGIVTDVYREITCQAPFKPPVLPSRCCSSPGDTEAETEEQRG